MATRPKLTAISKIGRVYGTSPLTSEVEYTPEELEFMLAMDKFKRETGCKFPTWCEVYHVLLSLGYQKGASNDNVAKPNVVQVNNEEAK